MRLHLPPLLVLLAVALAIHLERSAAESWQSRDMNPVTVKETTQHAPLAIVRDGPPVVSIVAVSKAAGARVLRILVHQPDWSKHEELKKNRPEAFQQRKDRSRAFEMLYCGSDNLADFAGIQFVG